MFTPFGSPSPSNGYRMENPDFSPYYRSYTGPLAQPSWNDSRRYGYGNHRSDSNLYGYVAQPGYGESRDGRADDRSYGWPGYEQGGWGRESSPEGYRTSSYGEFRPYSYYGNHQPAGMERDPQEWGNYGPLANFAETPDANLMIIELPGLDGKELNLQVAGNTITLTAVRHPYWQNNGGAVYYHTTEGRFGTMRRTFRLPPGVSPAQIQASFNNGILTVILPKPSLPPTGGNHQGIPVSNVMINNQ